MVIYVTMYTNTILQYLQWYPLFFKTSFMRLGMDSTNFTSTGSLCKLLQQVCRAVSNSDRLLGLFCWTLISIMLHKLSIGLSSGEFPGHGDNGVMLWSSIHFVVALDRWHGAPSSWKMKFPSGKSLDDIGRRWSVRVFCTRQCPSPSLWVKHTRNRCP